MYLCVLNQQGEILLHRNMPCSADFFLKAIAPYREDVAVAVECIFTWYWLADLCAKQNIPFVLGHALYLSGRAELVSLPVVENQRVLSGKKDTLRQHC